MTAEALQDRHHDWLYISNNDGPGTMCYCCGLSMKDVTPSNIFKCKAKVIPPQ